MALLNETLIVKVDVKSVSNELHRLIFRKGSYLCHSDLEKKICMRFGLPLSSSLRFTYKDNQDEMVVMAADDDIEDAVNLQLLNPLRLYVAVKSTGVPPDAKSVSIQRDDQGKKSVAKSERDVDTTVEFESAGEAYWEVSSMDSCAKGSDKGGMSQQSAGKVGGPEKGESSQKSGFAVPFGVEKKAQVDFEMGSGGNSENNDGAERIFHMRVQCDGCRMVPIVGPRFKSLVKHDYDLCETCHNRVEDKENYSRIDRPLCKSRHHLFWGSNCGGCGHCSPCRPPPALFGGRPFHAAHSHQICGPSVGPPPCGQLATPPPPSFFSPAPPFPSLPSFPSSNYEQFFSNDWSQGGARTGKLDSRFVRDVTIFDETELAPGTEFTKIWCLRNTGTVPWPKGTSLVHIDGARLGKVTSVVLSLPPFGLAVGEELEVAVDSVAPERPGRYASNWQLAAPSGSRFGHRVWVIIQVVSKGELLADESALFASHHAHDHQHVSLSFGKDQLAGTCGDLLVEVVASVLTAEREDVSVSSLPSTLPVIGGTDSICVTEDVIHGFLYVTSEAGQDGSTSVHNAVHDLSAANADTGHDSLPAGIDDSHDSSPAAIDDSDDSLSLKISENLSVSDPGELLSPEMANVSFLEVDAELNFGKVNGVPDSPSETEDTSIGGFTLLPYPSVESSAVAMDDFFIMAGAGDEYSMNFENVERSGDAVSENKLETEHVVASATHSALEQLKSMGFPDVDLNVDLLAKYDGDLMQTVDQLVAAAKWDPLLEELEDMGFMDVQMNRRLMFKHEGSVKRVVKELVEIYTAAARKLLEA